MLLEGRPCHGWPFGPTLPPGVSDCLHRNHLRAYNTCKESLRGRWSLGICIFTSFLDDYNVNKS